MVARRSVARWLVCLALALVTFAAYAPVAWYPFINLDDPSYVTGNLHVRQGLSWQAVKWAFTAAHSGNCYTEQSRSSIQRSASNAADAPFAAAVTTCFRSESVTSPAA